MHGQESVLPIEVTLGAYGVAKQNDLYAIDYYDWMMNGTDEVTNKRYQDFS